MDREEFEDWLKVNSFRMESVNPLAPIGITDAVPVEFVRELFNTVTAAPRFYRWPGAPKKATGGKWG